MKIYTGFGDEGDTALFGGPVVKKNHTRVEIYGTLDELNSMLGLLRAKSTAQEVDELINKIQNEIFVISSEIATPDEKMRNRFTELIDVKHIHSLEKQIDLFTEKLEPLKHFVLPGGSEQAAIAHLSRTICRRAERKLVPLKDDNSIRRIILVYLNRLSDLLFVLSRYLNKIEGYNDVEWKGLK